MTGGGGAIATGNWPPDGSQPSRAENAIAAAARPERRQGHTGDREDAHHVIERAIALHGGKHPTGTPTRREAHRQQHQLQRRRGNAQGRPPPRSGDDRTAEIAVQQVRPDSARTAPATEDQGRTGGGWSRPCRGSRPARRRAPRGPTARVGDREGDQHQPEQHQHQQRRAAGQEAGHHASRPSICVQRQWAAQALSAPGGGEGWVRWGPAAMALRASRGSCPHLSPLFSAPGGRRGWGRRDHPEKSVARWNRQSPRRVRPGMRLHSTSPSRANRTSAGGAQGVSGEWIAPPAGPRDGVAELDQGPIHAVLGRIDVVVRPAHLDHARRRRARRASPAAGCPYAPAGCARRARRCAARPASRCRRRRARCPSRARPAGRQHPSSSGPLPALRAARDIGDRRGESAQRRQQLLELRRASASRLISAEGRYISDEPPECRSQTKSARGHQLVLDEVGDLLRHLAVGVAGEGAVEVAVVDRRDPPARDGGGEVGRRQDDDAALDSARA